MNTVRISPTPFGPIILLWSLCGNIPKIIRIVLSTPSVSAEIKVAQWFPHATTASCTKIDMLAANIQAYLKGVDVEFPLESVALHQCSSFQKAVLHATYNIRRGETSTYAQIARAVGNVNSVRAAGHALATNPFPLIIPCHRIVRSDGNIGKYQGGVSMKQTLLRYEGFSTNSRRKDPV